MRKKLVRAMCIFLLTVCLLGSGTNGAALRRNLRVAVSCNLPPYQFLTAEGECTGMHIEMLDAIAKEKGFFLHYVPLDTVKQCMDALAAEEVDLVLGVISTATEEYSCDLTDSLSTATLSLLAPKESTSSAKGMLRTAVFSADTARNTLLSNLGYGQYLVVGDQVEVFRRQQAGDVSAFIGLRESLLYQMKESGTMEEYVTLREYLDTVNYTMAVRKGDRDLLRTLNDGIARFRTDTRYATVYKKWIVQEGEEQQKRLFHQALLVAAVVAFLMVSYSAFSTRLRRLLQKQVAEQTREIQTSKHQLELQLAQIQTENDLRNRIIKYSPSAMLLFDSEGKIALLNKRAQAMAGLSSGEEATSVWSLSVFRDILQREGPGVFTGNALPEGRSLRLESPGGFSSYRYTMHQVVQYGKINLILLAVQDVTEEERARQEDFEQEKSRTLNQVVAGIAHEIRNPLTAIRTFASLVGSDGGDRQVQESFATYVPREVERIDRLIEGLIHYAKPSKPRPERIEVGQLAEESLALIRPVLKKSRVGLVCDCAPELYIIADRDQLKQILVNLLLNGLEAVEKRRQRRPEEATLGIRLTAAIQGDEAVLTLRDEGTGMSAQEIQRCTEPFFSTKDTGTGLGLALCQQYIADNGGTMTICSEEMVYTEITLRFRRVEA